MPEPELQTTALRYAAGDLSADVASAFEERLALDQDARDALSEAVRLSAAAIGQSAPKPGDEFRNQLRDRLSWTRSRKLAWAGVGAGVFAVCAIVGLSLADSAEPTPPDPVPVVQFVSSTEPAPAPHEPEQLASRETFVATESAGGNEPCRSVAEMWAEMSTPDGVEKARDDEARLRQRVHNLAQPSYLSSTSKVDAP